MHHLTEIGLNIVRLSIWLVLLAVVFVPLERLFAARPGKIFRPGFWPDLGYYFLSGLIPAAVLGVVLGGVAWGAHRLMPGSVAGTIAHAPLWLRAVAALVVCEVGFYWGHRWCHEVPLLWRFHAIHHSAPHVDWLVNTRAHPLDLVFTRICGLAPLYILGLATPFGADSTMIAMAVMLGGILWGFFIHANLRWRFGPLEWLISTPGFHHWHHTNDDPAYVNKNFAPLFPWVDWIFGSLYLPRHRLPAVYGIAQSMPPTLAGQLLEPFALHGRRALSSSIPSTASAADSDGLPVDGRNIARASANP